MILCEVCGRRDPGPSCPECAEDRRAKRARVTRSYEHYKFSGQRPAALVSDKIYLIGSLRNPRVPEIAESLRKLKYEVFDDWHASGKDADQEWRDYEIARGHSFVEALQGHFAKHALALDKHHLDQCDTGILVLPAGKSGHLELGYLLGQGKAGYILLDGQPERFDLMYGLATGVFRDVDEMLATLVPR